MAHSINPTFNPALGARNPGQPALLATVAALLAQVWAGLGQRRSAIDTLAAAAELDRLHPEHARAMRDAVYRTGLL